MTRINQEIVRALSEIILYEVKDPRIGKMTSVTGADAGTDLKTCKVYVSGCGTEEELSDTLTALRRAEGFIRHSLAEKLNLRNTPQLTFLPDRSVSYGMHIDSILSGLTYHDESEWEEAGPDGNADENADRGEAE